MKSIQPTPAGSGKAARLNSSRSKNPGQDLGEVVGTFNTEAAMLAKTELVRIADDEGLGASTLIKH